MSRLRFNNLGTNPPAPAIGKTEIFIGPDGKLKQIDSNAVVTDCTAGQSGQAYSLAVYALNTAWAGTTAAKQASDVAVSALNESWVGTNAASAASGIAVSALNESWVGTNAANQAYSLATTALNTAWTGTTAAANAQSTANQALAYSGTTATTIVRKLNAAVATSVSATGTTCNLSFTPPINTAWVIECQLTSQCSSTGGVKYEIVAPTGSTVEGWLYSSTSAATTLSYQRFTAVNTYTSTAVHTVATTPAPDIIQACIVIGGNSGPIAINFAPVTNGQTATVFAGATMAASQATGV